MARARRKARPARAADSVSLELWHGPSAFKDYALQFMPRLLVEAKRRLGGKRPPLFWWPPPATRKAALEATGTCPAYALRCFTQPWHQ